jgi:hypothetical protein
MIKLKNKIDESLDCPYEGIFWVINNNFIEFKDKVDITGRFSTDLQHRKIWPEIKNKYGDFDFDYFPRGRVMVNVINKNETFDDYNVYIYIDNCINNESVINEIVYEFNLRNNCDIKYIGSEGGITEDHYTCHNCK